MYLKSSGTPAEFNPRSSLLSHFVFRARELHKFIRAPFFRIQRSRSGEYLEYLFPHEKGFFSVTRPTTAFHEHHQRSAYLRVFNLCDKPNNSSLLNASISRIKNTCSQSDLLSCLEVALTSAFHTILPLWLDSEETQSERKRARNAAVYTANIAERSNSRMKRAERRTRAAFSLLTTRFGIDGWMRFRLSIQRSDRTWMRGRTRVMRAPERASRYCNAKPARLRSRCNVGKPELAD